MDHYIDSRGAEMEPISFSEALELVRDLAQGNQLEDRHLDGDEALTSIRNWQEIALDTVSVLVAQHAEALDALPETEQAQDWPDAAIKPERDMDPSQPANAIRIILELGEANALDTDAAKRDIELADEIDRQQQACDVVRDLLGMHGTALGDVATPAPVQP